MILPPITYRRAGSTDRYCYMCFPRHRADWIAGSVLGLCDAVFQRLVAEGKALAADEKGGAL